MSGITEKQERQIWSYVDEYIDETFGIDDDALRDSTAAGKAAGLPEIQVSAPAGRFLEILALATGARRILEIGTLFGYSAINLARGLGPDGTLVTCELDPKHAEVARRNFERADVADRIELRLGRASDTLDALAREGAAPFDLIFIDADKPGYPDYLTKSLKLARKGTLIVADNVVRQGAVADPESQDTNVVAVRRFNEMLAKEPRLRAGVIQTVGTKGYDGFALAVVIR